MPRNAQRIVTGRGSGKLRDKLRHDLLPLQVEETDHDPLGNAEDRTHHTKDKHAQRKVEKRFHVRDPRLEFVSSRCNDRDHAAHDPEQNQECRPDNANRRKPLSTPALRNNPVAGRQQIEPSKGATKEQTEVDHDTEHVTHSVLGYGSKIYW